MAKKEGKISMKKILSKTKVEVIMKPYKAESSWDDTNRFFKHHKEETKRSMFLE